VVRFIHELSYTKRTTYFFGITITLVYVLVYALLKTRKGHVCGYLWISVLYLLSAFKTYKNVVVQGVRAKWIELYFRYSEWHYV